MSNKVTHYRNRAQLLDIASGLQYLHSRQPKIVHGDLKGMNILVSSTSRACLADFGLAAARDSGSLHASSTRQSNGTLRWQGSCLSSRMFFKCLIYLECLAPELVLFDGDILPRNSRETDIYALGCVFYEVQLPRYPLLLVVNKLPW